MGSGLRSHAGREAVGGAAGQLLGLDPAAFGPAGIDGEVAAQRQLLQADELRALSRRDA